MTIVVTVAVTLIIGSVFGLFLRKQARQNQSSYVLAGAENVADKTSLALNESRLIAEGFADNELLAGWLDDAEANKDYIDAWLGSLNLGGRYSAVYILDNDGQGLAATDPSFIKQDYSFRKYFQESILGQPGFETAVGANSGQFGYYFSAPIKGKDGNIAGVLVFKLSPSYISDIILEKTINRNDKIMLADDHGVIIYSTDKERISKSFAPLSPERLAEIKNDQTYAGNSIDGLQYPEVQSLIDKKITAPSMVSMFDAIEGIDETIAVVPIDNYPLFLVSESETDNFFAAMATIANIGALLLLAFLLVIFMLLVVSRFLKPVTQLELMADNISRGDFDQKNPIVRQDELGNLGKAIENMGLKLKNYYSDIAKGVDLKTKELQEKTESLENVKKAIMNILEDVKEEKDKSARLAKELEKFKLALDNSSDSIVIADSAKKLIYANSGTKTITGYSPDEILGTEAGEVWGHSVAESYREKIWQAVGKKKTVFSGAISSQRKNGENFDAQISIYPLLDEKGGIEFLVCIERDITKEKQIDRAKTEFVSLASHQLKTPLSSINWYAEMLLDGDAGKLNEQQEDFVKEIHKGNQRMVDLVNSLLNVSRLELGTFMIEPKPTKIADICESVLNESLVNITRKKIKIVRDYEKDLPVVDVDPKLTRIIAQNLISNAIKYTPDGGQVTVRLKKDKKNFLMIVSDNGYGIPDSQKDKIFDKLFRADNIKTKDVEGTGLGLYLVKSILDSSGGNVSFKSEENKGSEFTASIPLSGMKKKAGEKALT